MFSRLKFGGFAYAPYRTQYDPTKSHKGSGHSRASAPTSAEPAAKPSPSVTKVKSQVAMKHTGKCRPGRKPAAGRKLTEKLLPSTTSSIASKRASAVKLKYSSIISTRRSKLLKAERQKAGIHRTDAKDGGGTSALQNLGSTCDEEKHANIKEIITERVADTPASLKAKDDDTKKGQSQRSSESEAADKHVSGVFTMDEESLSQSKVLNISKATAASIAVPSVPRLDVGWLEDSVRMAEEGSKAESTEVEAENKETKAKEQENQQSKPAAKSTESSTDTVSQNVKVPQTAGKDAEGDGNSSPKPRTSSKLAESRPPTGQSPAIKNAMLQKLVATCKEKLGVEEDQVSLCVISQSN